MFTNLANNKHGTPPAVASQGTSSPKFFSANLKDPWEECELKLCYFCLV
jgi:hypothetical protein